jgi:hypothetical protein
MIEERVHINETRGKAPMVKPTMVTKLDFPRFNGRDDTTSWICRSEQFFEFQNIPNEEWISLTAYHLEGEALFWYQLLNSEEEIT